MDHKINLTYTTWILDHCLINQNFIRYQWNYIITAIGQFHISENILINFLIAFTSRLDALDAHKMYCNQWKSDD